MSWGDVPAWVALGLAAAAGWVAALARRDSRRAADAAEGALELQRQEAQERREAARPRPDLVLERGQKQGWVLRNRGAAPATGVTVDAERARHQVVDAPTDVTLAPNEGHLLFVIRPLGVARLTHIWVTWDGHEAPIALPLPFDE